VNSVAAVPDEQFAGAATELAPAQWKNFEKWAGGVCAPTVSEFLGRSVQNTPYQAYGHLTADGRAVECSVGVAAGKPMSTGSLRYQNER
jgi:hypothetical protein